MECSHMEVEQELSVKFYKTCIPLPIASKSHSVIYRERQILIDYLSIIAYPDLGQQAAKKRKDFVDAIYTAILREHGLTNRTGLKKYTHGKSWTSIDKSIAAGVRRIYRSFVLFQCFEHFSLHKKNEPDSIYSWNDYLIRGLAFYQDHEEGYGFERANIDFQVLKQDIILYPESKEARYDDYTCGLRSIKEHWKQVRKTLHLLEGIVTCYRLKGIYSMPPIKSMIKKPSWVYDAIEISKEVVLRYSFDIEEKNHRVNIDSSEFIVVHSR